MTRVIWASVVAALGGLLFGFDTAVISGAEGALRNLYNPTYEYLSTLFGSPAFWHGTLVSSALLGTIIGSLAFAKPADRYGRRPMLMLMGILYLVSAIGSAFAWNAESFTFFRLIGGLGVGGASVVAPMYVAEIAPAKMRGRLVAMVQLNIVLGILVAYLSNYIIASFDLGSLEWRWMFGVEAVPALAFTLLLFTNPRSPRWLIAQGRDQEAEIVLKEIGGGSFDVTKEFNAIRHSLEQAREHLAEKFFQRKYLTPILLAIAIAAFNQLSGINALIYYTRRIFEMAGASGTSALLQSVIIGGVNLLMTAAALTVIDKLGRKKLMLVGSIGYIVSLSATAIAFYTDTTGPVVLASLIVFIGSHAFGQGAVIWVFIGEIFPNSIRARGQSLGSFVHWIMAAVISLTFPMIAEVSGANIFAFYAVCMIGQLLWVIFVMPETKGIPLEEMNKKLGID
ncbi:MAG: sugar porter family MFS transporter [Bacteroidetes bacterium]|nr:sugar porter family MFS transporter [Bacteroidota bacterium]